MNDLSEESRLRWREGVEEMEMEKVQCNLPPGWNERYDLPCGGECYANVCHDWDRRAEQDVNWYATGIPQLYDGMSSRLQISYSLLFNLSAWPKPPLDPTRLCLAKWSLTFTSVPVDEVCRSPSPSDAALQVVAPDRDAPLHYAAGLTRFVCQVRRLPSCLKCRTKVKFGGTQSACVTVVHSPGGITLDRKQGELAAGLLLLALSRCCLGHRMQDFLLKSCTTALTFAELIQTGFSQLRL